MVKEESGFLAGSGVAKVMVGTSAFGGLYSSMSEEACYEVVLRCLELGWRTFDTAPHYGLGISEERLGKALNRVWSLKKDVLFHLPTGVFTKVGRVVKNGDKTKETKQVDANDGLFVDAPDDRYAVVDFTGPGVIESLAGSSRRLNLPGKKRLASNDERDVGGEKDDSLPLTPTIDGVRVHDPEISEEEAFRHAFHALKNFSPDVEVSIGTNECRVAEKAIPCVDAVLLANRFNLLDQSGSRVLAECYERGKPVHLAGVYASGLLAGGDTYGYSRCPDQTILDKLNTWQRFLKSTPKFQSLTVKSLALAFAFVPLAVTHVVVGLRSKEQVDDTANMLSDLQTYDDDFWFDLFTQARHKELIDPHAYHTIIEPRFLRARMKAAVNIQEAPEQEEDDH